MVRTACCETRETRALALACSLNPRRKAPNECAPCVCRAVQVDVVGVTAPRDGPLPAARAFVRLGACSSYWPLPCSRAAAEALNHTKLIRLLRTLPGFSEQFKERYLDCITRVHVLKGPLTADTPTESDEAKDNVIELPDNYMTIASAAPHVATGPHLFIRVPTPRRESERQPGPSPTDGCASGHAVFTLACIDASPPFACSAVSGRALRELG